MTKTDIDELYYDAIDLLQEMIRLPSFSREESSVADLLEKKIQSDGFFVERLGNNVWVKSPDYVDNRPTILLNSHIDTVKPVSGWEKDPFIPLIVDDKLYGLGSNDAGASVVSLLHVFYLLCNEPQSYNLIFLASCEEEISGINGIEATLKKIPTPTFAIVGEPTEMQPAIAEKGLMVLDCVAHGKSGHAARCEGINAIYEAIQDIEWFKTYRFADESELLGPVKMSVTMVHAGTQHNVIPDQCNYTVDIRSNECYSNEKIFNIVQKHVKSEVKARSFRLNSSKISLENPFIQRAIIAGREPYGSPTLSDQALMNFPSVKMGPGKSARSHTANEYIRLYEIREGIELYYKLLNGLHI